MASEIDDWKQSLEVEPTACAGPHRLTTPEENSWLLVLGGTLGFLTMSAIAIGLARAGY